MKKVLVLALVAIVTILALGYVVNNKMAENKRESYVQGCAYAAMDIITNVSGMVPPVDAIVEKCQQIYKEVSK